MSCEYFQRWLCIRIISRFETKSLESEFCKELSYSGDQMSQTQVIVSNKAFNLVELSKMSAI